MKTISLTLFSLSLSQCGCQSLIEALSAHSQLSQFRDLLREHPRYVANVSGTSSPITILASTNEAFLNYEVASGQSIHSLSPKTVDDLLLYQTFNETVQPSDYSTPEGLITETLLKDPTYDLRSAASGRKPGQVVWMSSTNMSLTVRQLSTGFVQSGTGTQIAIEPIAGRWSGGNFFAVNGFLTLPISCTATFDVKGLSSLQTSLTRTNLSTTLDTFPDVICLAPDNRAFLKAGSPDTKADVGTLVSALEFHTIQGPGYTTDFHDGDIIQSINNMSILVTKNDDGTIFFNDAKVLASNQIVKNGVVHVLDRVMSPMNATKNSTPSSSSSSSSTSKSSPALETSSTASSAGGSSTTSSTASAATSQSAGEAAALARPGYVYSLPLLGMLVLLGML